MGYRLDVRKKKCQRNVDFYIILIYLFTANLGIQILLSLKPKRARLNDALFSRPPLTKC